MRANQDQRPAGFTAERAAFWRVSVRVLQMWLANGVPVESTEKMIEWYSGLPLSKQNKLTPEFRMKLTELQVESGNDPARVDPEWAAFDKDYTSNKPGDQSELNELKKLAAFHRFKHLRCSQRKDNAGAAAALNQLKPLSDLIHDMELRSQKLGRDLGDLVPRAALEVPARFMGYHLLNCARSSIAELAVALSRRNAIGPPPTAAEITEIIEPILLNAQVLQPIELAAAGSNQAAPPAWLVAALRAGVAEVLEQSP